MFGITLSAGFYLDNDEEWHTIPFSDEIFDYTNEFDTTNYCFSPKSPGVYFLDAFVRVAYMCTGAKYELLMYPNDGSYFFPGQGLYAITYGNTTNELQTLRVGGLVTVKTAAVIKIRYRMVNGSDETSHIGRRTGDNEYMSYFSGFRVGRGTLSD